MDFGETVNITTYQDFRDYDRVNDADKIAQFNSLYNDRTCSYLIRGKNRSDVRDILDDAEIDAALNTDYILIDRPVTSGSFFGTHVILDPLIHSMIEQAIWDFDNTVLEGERSTIDATRARLEAG